MAPSETQACSLDARTFSPSSNCHSASPASKVEVMKTVQTEALLAYDETLVVCGKGVESDDVVKLF